MREEILQYLKENTVDGFTVTDSLPWTKDGAPLYLSNLRVLYVDLGQLDQEPLIDTLDGCGLVIETATVSIYVTTDAKTLQQNYHALVAAVKPARLSSAVSLGYTQRRTDLSTEYFADNLVTRFDMNFEKLIYEE